MAENPPLVAPRRVFVGGIAATGDARHNCIADFMQEKFAHNLLLFDPVADFQRLGIQGRVLPRS